MENYHKAYNKGHKEEEYFIPLKFDWKVDPDEERSRAVPAWKINKKQGSQYSFRQTVFTIPERMAKAIEDLAENK